jgi:hypothetical protein
MAKKITVPLAVLVFLYLMIIGFCFIILGLSVVAVYDINHGFKTREKNMIDKYCSKYLENDCKDHEKYEKCMQILLIQMQGKK